MLASNEWTSSAQNKYDSSGIIGDALGPLQGVLAIAGEAAPVVLIVGTTQCVHRCALLRAFIQVVVAETLLA